MNFSALARERFSALDYERRWENTGAGLSSGMRIGLARWNAHSEKHKGRE